MTACAQLLQLGQILSLVILTMAVVGVVAAGVWHIVDKIRGK